MKRRIFLFLAAVALLLSLIGCGKTREAASPAEAPAAVAESAPVEEASPEAAETSENDCDHGTVEYQILEKCGCYSVGKARTVCTLCGETLSAVAIPALGHAFNYSSDADGHWKQCSRCGEYTIFVPHEFNGKHVCTVCGYGCTHEYEDTVIDSTCIAEGFTVHTCKLCGFAHADSFTAPSGHDYVASFDGEDGTLRYTCTACGNSFTVR